MIKPYNSVKNQKMCIFNENDLESKTYIIILFFRK
jgi:hypothetical protein